MRINVSRMLKRYTQALGVAGLGLMVAVLVTDLRWIAHPISTAVLMLSIVALRGVPVRLSKYSYLTQAAVPALVGAVCVGPAPVVAAPVSVAPVDAS